MCEFTETTEHFPAGTTEAQMQKEVKLKTTAGALSSEYSGSEENGWTLTTRWEKL